MAMLRFSGVIQLRGINPYLAISAKRAATLKPGWRKPMPVRVRINGKPTTPWRINMMPAGDGSFYPYMHGDVRKASNTKVGDRVLAEVRFDAAYKNGPAHPMPGWFKTALSKNAKARQAWKKLTPSRKKEVLRYFAAFKSPEARERNLEHVMHALGGYKERFMGRTWN